MTTYNTKNPVPSADARDRYDNSQVFDDLMNGAAPSTPDRLGVLRQSWAGMEQAFAGSEADRAAAFQAFLEASGWSSLGTYAAGINIISHTQTVDYQGQPYQLKPSVPASLDAPHVTTGDWATEGVNFKLVGDNSLRQELASGDGGQLVSFLQIGDGAKPRSVSGRLRDSVSVKDFGAVGDGVADDSAEIDSADAAGPVLIPPGTYRISANITLTNQLIFHKGAQLSIDVGITVTMNCVIDAGMYQIFTGAGSVVIGKANKEALPEWFGAGGGSGIDFPAIQKCIDACRTNGVTTVLGQNYLGSPGGSPIQAYIDSPLTTRNYAIISAVSQAQAFQFNPGNYVGPDNVIPALSGFSGDAIRLYGTAFCRVKCPSVANGTGAGGGSNAVNFYTDAAAPTSLDNRVEVFLAGPSLANAVVFTGCGSANGCIMQGNEFYCNFSVSCLRSCLFFESAAGSAWDGQIVEFAAIDPDGIVGALALSNVAATPVPRLRFSVTTWLGGFGGAGTTWVDGKFDELDLYLRAANNLTSYSQMSVQGVGGRISLGNTGLTADQLTAPATTTIGVANFNGGAPLTQTRFASSITIPVGGLANNTALNCWLYSPFVSFCSSQLKVQFTNSQGVILQGLTTTANKNEILMTVRNVSGGTLTAGTVITFFIDLGC